jgi:hypothetical protein
LDEYRQHSPLVCHSAADLSQTDCTLDSCTLQVRVLKIAGGKIQLTMKTEEERKRESDLSESGVGAGSTRKARTLLEAALANVGFKHTPKPEAEVQTPSDWTHPS